MAKTPGCRLVTEQCVTSIVNRVKDELGQNPSKSSNNGPVGTNKGKRKSSSTTGTRKSKTSSTSSTARTSQLTNSSNGSTSARSVRSTARSNTKLVPSGRTFMQRTGNALRSISPFNRSSKPKTLVQKRGYTPVPFLGTRKNSSSGKMMHRTIGNVRRSGWKGTKNLTSKAANLTSKAANYLSKAAESRWKGTKRGMNTLGYVAANTINARREAALQRELNSLTSANVATRRAAENVARELRKNKVKTQLSTVRTNRTTRPKPKGTSNNSKSSILQNTQFIGVNQMHKPPLPPR